MMRMKSPPNAWCFDWSGLTRPHLMTFARKGKKTRRGVQGGDGMSGTWAFGLYGAARLCQAFEVAASAHKGCCYPETGRSGQVAANLSAQPSHLVAAGGL